MKNRLNQLDHPAPKLPSTVSGPGAKVWRTLQSDYAIRDAGGLAVLTVACEAFARMRQAQGVLKREGLTIRDARGQLKNHPLLQVERDCRAQFISAIKTLNLDLEPLQYTVGRPAGGSKALAKLMQVK